MIAEEAHGPIKGYYTQLLALEAVYKWLKRKTFLAERQKCMQDTPLIAKISRIKFLSDSQGVLGSQRYLQKDLR